MPGMGHFSPSVQRSGRVRFRAVTGPKRNGDLSPILLNNSVSSHCLSGRLPAVDFCGGEREADVMQAELRGGDGMRPLPACEGFVRRQPT